MPSGTTRQVRLNTRTGSRAGRGRRTGLGRVSQSSPQGSARFRPHQRPGAPAWPAAGRGRVSFTLRSGHRRPAATRLDEAARHDAAAGSAGPDRVAGGVHPDGRRVRRRGPGGPAARVGAAPSTSSDGQPRRPPGAGRGCCRAVVSREAPRADPCSCRRPHGPLPGLHAVAGCGSAGTRRRAGAGGVARSASRPSSGPWPSDVPMISSSRSAEAASVAICPARGAWATSRSGVDQRSPT